MKTVCIIQARIGSTRLPGKVMLDLCGSPVLWHVVTRVSRAKSVDQVVVATTDQKQDDVICDLCRSEGFALYRGSEHDVLQRYFHAATEYQADSVVRITSDCPLIDPAIISSSVELFWAERPHYISNVIPPRTFPIGLDTEVFSFEALRIAHSAASLPDEREHVTPFILNHPEIFTLRRVARSIDLSNLRWTLDTAEDYRFIKGIYNSLYPAKNDFATEDILALLGNI